MNFLGIGWNSFDQHYSMFIIKIVVPSNGMVEQIQNDEIMFCYWLVSKQKLNIGDKS